jgi:hypothetical protein
MSQLVTRFEWIYFHDIRIKGKYYFSASERLFTLELVKLIYKYTGIYFTLFPADANPSGKWCLFVSKIRKELTGKITLIMYRLI